MKRISWIVALVWLTGSSWLFASQALVEHAQSAILMDMESGRVLYAYHADEVRIPASLTKIVSLFLAYQALEAHTVALDTPITVSERAALYNMPARSSLMGIEPGQRLTFYDLMLGMAIASGNDASVALAEQVSGSVEAFVQAMNDLVQELGLEQSYFIDPSGIGNDNRTTAYEYAHIARAYLKRYPQAIAQLHSVERFSYPSLRQMNHAGVRRYTLTYSNANKLITSYEGADGLKTGYLDESGYNLVATAKRGDMRLIAVIMGVKAPGTQTGSARRESDARALFDYGFANYRYYNISEHPQFYQYLQVPVLGGNRRSTELALSDEALLAYPLREDEWQASRLSRQSESLTAPIAPQVAVGELVLLVGDELWSSPLITQEKIDRLPFWLYLNDIIERKILQLFQPKEVNLDKIA